MVNLLNNSDLTNDLNGITFINTQENILSVNDSLLSVDTEKLKNEYCSNSFIDNSLTKYENMYNDFKILLKIVESVKQGEDTYSNNLINFTSNKTSSKNKTNLIDF